MWPWVKIQIVPPVNIPIPTKIGSKMGGEVTHQPKWYRHVVVAQKTGTEMEPRVETCTKTCVTPPIV